jgi:chloramphenicol-sensitive protein RarD
LQRSQQHDSRAGLAYAVAAFGLWGVMPIYFRALDTVSPLELLCHRIVWSVVLLAVLVTALGRWRHVRACLADRRTRSLLLISTTLIAANWFVFIYGVSKQMIVQNSLGYFINPLLNILIGVCVFRERLRSAQWLALLLATAGLVYLIAVGGDWPWIAFFLAGSFALYGLIRKVSPIDTLLALTVETLLVTPAALAWLVWLTWTGAGSMGRLGWDVDALLLLSGVVTIAPLFCFGQAARMLRMSTLGFIQYLAPTLQFLMAVLLFGESFGPARQVSFALIWSALALVSIDSLLRPRDREVTTPVGPPRPDSPRSDPSPAADVRVASRP